MSRTNTVEPSLAKKDSRIKSRSFLQMCSKTKPDQFHSLREFNVELTPIFQKKITAESLTAYTQELASQVYESDPLGIGKIIEQFLRKDIQKLRQRIQQRLSLLAYSTDSLKFKPFAQVQRQILKEWKKNVLLASINTIWVTKMLAHKFTSVHQFTQQYKKQVSLIANLTHFYFKNALSVLDGKNLSTFVNLQQDTAHKILNSLRDWKDLYTLSFIPLLRRKSKNHNFLMNMDFDPRTLNINSQYLDLQSGKSELLKTIEKIREFSRQSSIHTKIDLLKQIRTTFVKQIQQSRDQILKNKHFGRISPMEKDDVIGCMIYCIIQGQITEIQGSIQAISWLLGPNNELLSRKGVDSYRADLESAVEYLCQQQQQQQKGSKSKHTFMEEQVKIEIAYKSTQLELLDLA